MSRDFSHPLDPARRPQRSRSTVRLLVIDPDDQLLLFHSLDPGNGVRWWETPGGGIDPGESEVEAAIRELQEETGQVISPDDLIGPLAHRHVSHGYSDIVVSQDDTFYAVRSSHFVVDTAGFTDDEQEMTLGNRWWSPADLRTTTETIWPVDLLDLVALLGSPSEWPVGLCDVEESSVPVDTVR